MASWSTRRKYGYFFAVIVLAALFIGIPTFLVFYKAPTCFDGKQNGDERGIDCGGSCALLCAADFSAPHILWTYSVPVVPGVYNALAYIQNPNQGVEARSVSYLFKLYDDKGLLVTQRTGNAFIPAGQRFAVFEGGIQTGERKAFRTTFEFTSTPRWQAGRIFSSIRVLDVVLDQSARPSAEVKIGNMAVDQGFADLTAFIILYDKDDNRVSFSKTLIDSITPSERKSIYFTWPTAFSSPIVRSEVMFVANP